MVFQIGRKLRNSLYSCLLAICLSCITTSSTAQIKTDLSAVKVEELSDQQILAFILEWQKLGISDQELETRLIQMGMTRESAGLLRNRITSLKTNSHQSIQQQKQILPGSTTTAQRQKVSDSLQVAQKNELTDTGFVFQFPELETALRDLLTATGDRI
jgi:hypothetical protein